MNLENSENSAWRQRRKKVSKKNQAKWNSIFTQLFYFDSTSSPFPLNTSFKQNFQNIIFGYRFVREAMLEGKVLKLSIALQPFSSMRK